ncbi:MAG: NAD-dependent deacylase [Bacteroidetes bacterium]|nr:NAD-dependent deacylase [Bacteroidota bacterium]HET6243217.1 NAD-dependent deacylase [Bacteroidia bacterium]
MTKKELVVFTGAGISAESGIKTFRDSGGLWEEFDIYEVATPEAWNKNQKLVLEFYNARRKQVLSAIPNAAHLALVQLEQKFNVNIITQNIDDLHERAGSKNVLHLHGEINKARSTIDPLLIYPIIGHEIKSGEICEKGSQLRPHIVWFGEEVPEMEQALKFVKKADIFIVIGTSLNVFPAASLIYNTRSSAQTYLIDPNAGNFDKLPKLKVIRENACKGVCILADLLM